MSAANESAAGFPAGGGGNGMAFFRIFLGVMGPEEAQDRVVLMNPTTGSMVVLEGDAAIISALLSGGGAARNGSPPASRASIKALKTVEVIGTGEEVATEECPVCLEELHAVNVVKEMPCRHRFHGGCIEKWLGMHGSCPVCRHRMPEEGEEGSRKTSDGGEAEEEEGRRRAEVWVTLASGMSGEEAGRVGEGQEDGGVAEQR